MDNNLEKFFDTNSNEFFSTKSLILNYANYKTYRIKNLAWFFNQRVEYKDYVCVSFSPSDNEYLCNKNTLLELIDYLKFIDILSRLKTERFLCTNVRCCPSSLILTPQFGDAPPKYIISC